MAATFALNGGYAAAVTVLPLHATATWAATPAQLGIMFSVFSLLGFLGAPLGGWVADKFGRRAGVTPALLLAGSSAAACAAIGEHEAMLCAMDEGHERLEHETIVGVRTAEGEITARGCHAHLTMGHFRIEHRLVRLK